MGQTRPDPEAPPVFGPSRLLDFELEMPSSPSTASHSVNASRRPRRRTTFSAWSCSTTGRPATSKSGNTFPLDPSSARTSDSISPWSPSKPSTTFALGPQQDPEVLDYLKYEGNSHYDVPLEVEIIPEGTSSGQVVCRSNFRHMYWNMRQQLAHHTVNGCNCRRHDGERHNQRTRKGLLRLHAGNLVARHRTRSMPDGTERKFIRTATRS